MLERAPRLTVVGRMLRWEHVVSMDRYILVRRGVGRSSKYRVVDGTSLTPAADPGHTVTYTVRTAVVGSRWARPVKITYASAGGRALARISSDSVHGKGHGRDHESPSSGSTTGGGGATTKEQSYSGEKAESPTSTTTSTTSTTSGESSTTSAPTTVTSEFGPFTVGVNTNMEGWGAEAVPAIAEEMRSLGVKWAREEIDWAEVEAKKGVYDWSRFETMLLAAERDGITILPVIGYAPSWTSPEDAEEYAAFVKLAVQRYGPGTSANLQWWELWNEPYDAYAWSGQTPDAEAYGRDALAAARAAKSVSPSVDMLVAAEYTDAPQTGGTSPWETTWVNDMFLAAPELGKYIAGVAVHPYGGDPALPLLEPGSWKNIDGEWAFQRVDTIRAQFLEHGVNVPFWVTEVGWSTAKVSEAEQAADYAALFEAIRERPWIRALFPYCLREFSPEAGNEESAFGLLKFGSWEPKAAFSVVQKGFANLTS